MPVTFCLGRAGAGKTHLCIESIATALQSGDAAVRCILLVPEQASLEAERALVRRVGGYWQAEVWSFSRLVHRMLAEYPAPGIELSSFARPMLLRRIVDSDPRYTRIFGAALRTAGFIRMLDQQIRDWLLEGVTPGELRSALQPAEGARVGGLIDVFEAYRDFLGERWIDPALHLRAANDALQRCEWIGGARVWVDGFANFSGEEEAVLTTLARRSAQVTITLLLDNPDASTVDSRAEMFDPIRRGCARLTRRLRAAGVEIQPPILLQSAPRFRVDGLRELESWLSGASTAIEQAGSITRQQPSFSERIRQSDKSAGQLTLWEAANSADAPSQTTSAPSAPGLWTGVRVRSYATHRDELRAAAASIRRAIATSAGAQRFRDFAVIARDLDNIAEPAAEAFEDHGIPYFLDRRSSMAAHALTRFVDAALRAIVDDFPRSAMIELLRTGLSPLSGVQCELLEYVLRMGEVRGLAAWRRGNWDFGALRWGRRRKADSTEDWRDRETQAASSRILTGLRPLLDISHPADGAAWADALWRTFEAFELRAQLSRWIREANDARDFQAAQTHRLAWEAVCQTLDDLRLLLGEQKLTAGDLAAIVVTGLRSRTLGVVPPALDQVLISSIERSRHPDIRHAWLVGFNEGLFPRPANLSGLLPEEARAALRAAGLPAGPDRDESAVEERLLAYIAITRPSESLTISFARSSPAGEPLQPSSLLNELLATGRVAIDVSTSDEPPASLGDLADRVLAGDQAGDARWTELDHRVRAGSTGARYEFLLRGREYSNPPEAVAPPPPADHGVAWAGTPSELEQVVRCSARHFCERVLRLEGATQSRPFNWALAGLAHEIADSAVQRALADPRGIRKLTHDDWRKIVADAADSALERLPATSMEPGRRFLAHLAKNAVETLMLAHADRIRRGDFEPAYTEQMFGEGDATSMPPLELRLSDGRRADIRGRIDRIDAARAEKKQLLILYDYKRTAPKNLPDYLADSWLPLMLYAGAVHDRFAAEGGSVVGVFAAPLYLQPDVMERAYVADAPPDQRRMYLLRPVGRCTEQAADLLDLRAGSQPSPVANIRRKRVGYYRNCAVISDSEFAAYLELARRTAAHAIERLLSGIVEPAPLRDNGRLACDLCDFRPVCRFDRAFNTIRVPKTSLPILGSASPSDGGRG